MKDLLERLAKARAAREENRESGFSMIELIVVIAIIGILIAVAIPVYGNIQQTAKDNQLKNAAATESARFAASIATAGATPAIATATDDITFVLVAPASAAAADLTNYCVRAEPVASGALKDGVPAESGPGC
ncbi:MAG: type II secretion system protein [Nocardioides sp.]|uniref:type II secretion system protein n=1 Tax=Nocardioides sp. TaxID=35761 RepID=UPI003F0DF81C